MLAVVANKEGERYNVITRRLIKLTWFMSKQRAQKKETIKGRRSKGKKKGVLRERESGSMDWC